MPLVRETLSSVAVLVALGSLATTTVAGSKTVEVRMHGPGSGSGNFYFVAQEAVQRDLDLSIPQVEQIRKRVRELVEGQREFAREKAADKRKTKARALRQLRRQYEKDVIALLSAGQAERLRQIALYYRGTAAFWDAPIRKELMLTQEQLAKMDSYNDAYTRWDHQAEVEYRKDRDFTAYSRRLAENRKKRDQAQIQVMTEDQQRRWRKLLGEPFTGPIPSPILIGASPAASAGKGKANR
jgi:hypothetical protein